jgi:hypothetical protein
MSYNLSDIPKPVDRSEYESCMKRMTEKLLRISGVKSIFQVGGINTPGISDIDYYIVFKDGFTCTENRLMTSLQVTGTFFATISLEHRNRWH